MLGFTSAITCNVLSSSFRTDWPANTSSKLDHLAHLTHAIATQTGNLAFALHKQLGFAVPLFQGRDSGRRRPPSCDLWRMMVGPFFGGRTGPWSACPLLAAAEMAATPPGSMAASATWMAVRLGRVVPRSLMHAWPSSTSCAGALGSQRSGRRFSFAAITCRRTLHLATAGTGCHAGAAGAPYARCWQRSADG